MIIHAVVLAAERVNGKSRDYDKEMICATRLQIVRNLVRPCFVSCVGHKTYTDRSQLIKHNCHVHVTRHWIGYNVSRAFCFHSCVLRVRVMWCVLCRTRFRCLEEARSQEGGSHEDERGRDSSSAVLVWKRSECQRLKSSCHQCHKQPRLQ